MRICSAKGCAEPEGGVMLGYALHCCYCSVHVVVVSRCTVDTVECMYRVVNSTYRVHDICSYAGSYAVTNAKADVHCENDALAGIICEVS